ncbi:extracellular solute-binding protein [Erysipelothrix sp. HDW6B]|uniref:ABC transporter substrate-binding protein n=1 Tax=Erysipelothrix TaxID=1647 RepID=UPI00135CA3FD|nr:MULTISPECIES: extracellular solute-binding protein [Erysipelothrix]QIK85192.1 extracellular solute-binding protein [Erysipelothrix sp. HDW6B]
MKKILVLLLSLLVLTACGSKASGGAQTEADMAKAERVLEGTIQIYAPKGKNSDYLTKSMELYNQKYSANLKLDLVDVAPAIPMVQKITPMLVSDEKMPELVFMQDSVAGSIFEKFEDRFYSAEAFGFVGEHGSKFYPAKMNMLKNIAPSKQTFGFPNDWGNAAMFYNDAAFKEAGVNMEEVKTWDQFIEAGKKLNAATGKKLMYMRDTGEVDMINYLTEQQEVSMFDEAGNLNLLNDAVIKAYDVVNQIQEADLAAYGPSNDYIKIGQETGVILQGGWLASMQSKDFPDDSGNWRVAKLPQMIEGKDVAPMSGGSSYYVTKNSENATAAYQFITFALTDLDALQAYMGFMGLPANMEAYETEAAKKQFEYYGNQSILEELNEISKTSVNGYVYPYSTDLANYIQQASYDIQYNGADVKTALEKQANDFAQKYGIKVN